MGIDVHSMNFLLRARAAGARFDRTLTYGRQGLHVPHASLADRLASEGLAWQETEERGEPSYAEPFFRALGAEQCDSMDASDYEGATILHDLNLPVDPGLYGTYSMVVDCGTQEHLLNVAGSLLNAVNLLEPGGHLVMVNPANNFFGHGFYQFSPELFDAVMAPQNGMELIEILAVEHFKDDDRWFKVARPREAGCRVTLKSHFPVSLMVLARRTGDQRVDRLVAQQSDYLAAWNDEDSAAEIHKQCFRLPRFSLVRNLVRMLARKTVYPNALARSASFFQPIQRDRSAD